MIKIIIFYGNNLERLIFPNFYSCILQMLFELYIYIYGIYIKNWNVIVNFAKGSKKI